MRKGSLKSRVEMPPAEDSLVPQLMLIEVPVKEMPEQFTLGKLLELVTKPKRPEGDPKEKLDGWERIILNGCRNTIQLAARNSLMAAIALKVVQRLHRSKILSPQGRGSREGNRPHRSPRRGTLERSSVGVSVIA